VCTHKINIFTRTTIISVFYNLCHKLIKAHAQKIKRKPTTTFEIEKIMKFFKSKDSRGYDEISTEILKISSPFISSPLNYICNKVLIKGIFHDRLKFAITKLLYKKGSKTDMSNYRPISLLTLFSKILKK
jgi:hypothetical protein